jgi:AraC family transcriptional regulator of adaptative response/methylated-DNA-[protein]-cysteine methyltransferase
MESGALAFSAPVERRKQESGRFPFPVVLICRTQKVKKGKEYSPVDTDYGKVEKAIYYIEENAEKQPGLEKISAHVGLSPYHFQRVFKKWTGVSPKRFLQFLTVENAKQLLERSASVLETSYDVGLSGPGRLHDLFVSVESVTPGQFKSGGGGIKIEYGFHQTPYGRALFAIAADGITDIEFVQDEDEGKAVHDLAKKWPAADLVENPDATGEMARRIFGGLMRSGESSPIKIWLRGTNFQIKVWQALLKIPEGAIVSYSDVARSIGRPEAVRAVANAVGSNPISWLIPCHRVLRSSGAIGGYGGGIARKKIMLAKELGG